VFEHAGVIFQVSAVDGEVFCMSFDIDRYGTADYDRLI